MIVHSVSKERVHVAALLQLAIRGIDCCWLDPKPQQKSRTALQLGLYHSGIYKEGLINSHTERGCLQLQMIARCKPLSACHSIYAKGCNTVSIANRCILNRRTDKNDALTSFFLRHAHHGINQSFHKKRNYLFCTAVSVLSYADSLILCHFLTRA